jgi:hypothetical protein
MNVEEENYEEVKKERKRNQRSEIGKIRKNRSEKGIGRMEVW